LRYYGAKWRLAPFIISLFPDHECYVEPFGGAAGVLLRKQPSALEVYNDLDGEVVNFFRVLRERPADLIWLIESTPWSREEQRLSFEPCENSLERARRLYVRSWQTRGGPRTQRNSGWRYARRGNGQVPPNVTKLWNQVDHLWYFVNRLKRVQIDCDDALAVIERFDSPTTLFYLDPPYLPKVRRERWRKHAYQHEMAEEDHVRLADLLCALDGMAIISGYPSELYDELYASWHTETRSSVNELSLRTTEQVWISPNAWRAARQQPLFLLADTEVTR